MKITEKTLRIALFLNLALFVYVAHSQKRYNVWAFGDQAGLDFNHTPPIYLKTKSASDFSDYHPQGGSAPYYISSVCDKEGRLIFYTDGWRVWDYSHQALPRPPNRWPWTGNIMTLICPDPADDSLYYLFGIGDGILPNQFQYVQIKSSLPYCQIVYPEPLTTTNYYRVLQQNASLVMGGTGHCNGRDTWIITHTAGAFNSFLVSPGGVSATPVVSSIDASTIPAEKLDGGYSNLKFSANGEKMIVPLPAENKMVIFEFNNSTGKFSDPVKLSAPAGQTFEDVEISPDGSKLYVGSFEIPDPETGAELHYIFQMDLAAGTAEQIQQSMTQVTPLGDRVVCFRTCFIMHRTMQLGPDGRIYVGMREGYPVSLDVTLSVITNPNANADDLLYRRNYQDVKRMYKFINYNYIRSSSFMPKENGIQTQQMVCADRPAFFSLFYNNVDSVKWDFGDPLSDTDNFSSALKPQHTFPGPGDYAVQAIIYKHCNTDTANKTVTIREDRAVHVPESIGDTAICLGNSLLLDAKTANANAYLWDNGLISPQRKIEQAGHYKITVMNDCSMDKKEFDVIVKECPCETFIPTAFTPNHDGLNDLFKPVVQCGAKQYQLKIFSRYGDVVFETSDISKGWNGRIKNSDAASGVYIWLLHYINPNNKESITKKGTVTLIR